MILVVLGMHRSGTSPLTRAVSLLGAGVGAPETLVTAAPDNPRGFWENRRLLELNELLLEKLGGTSWSPPEPLDGWTRDPGLEAFRRDARSALAEAFPGEGPWVWKDPRTCLTLELWKELLGPCVAVFAVRNPLETVASLEARDEIPQDVGLCLWERHVRSALEATRDVPRVAVRYDLLLDDPVGETERLRHRLTELGVRGLVPADEKELGAFLDSRLRHARCAPEDFRSDPRVTPQQVELYGRLLSLAEGRDLPEGTPPATPLAGRVLQLYRSHVELGVVRAEAQETERALAAERERSERLGRERERADEARAAAQFELQRIVGSKAWAVARYLQIARRFLADWLKRGRVRQILARPAVRLWRLADEWHHRRNAVREAPAVLQNLGGFRDEATEWFLTRRTAAARDAKSAILNRPLVNVILTCHDDATLLPDMLMSLRGQTLQRFHLTVVDDASTDPASLEILERLARTTSDEVTLLRLPENVGPGAARNRGIASTDPAVPYIACVDADDVMHPLYLERTVTLLERRPDLGIAYFDWQHFGESDELVRPPEYHLPALLRENFMVVCALYRRSLWEQVGGYDETMRGGYEDWELWIRLAEAGWFGARVPEVLLYYRRRAGSVTEGAWASAPELVRMIQAKHADLYSPERLAEIEAVWSSPVQTPARRRSEPCPSRTRVSVVVPCFNQGATLEQTVDSILAQTYRDLEIVVVDDGSTDEETQAAFRRLEARDVRVHRQDNAGLAAARNAGIGIARGELILPLDADDVILPELVERLVGVLRREPGAGFAYSDILFFGEESGVHAQEEFCPALEPTTNHVTVCAMFRKADWQAVGGYNPNMKQGMEDWDFWVSLMERGCFGRLVPAPLFGYRVRGGSMSERMRPHVRELVSRIRANHPRLFRPEVMRKLRSEQPPTCTAHLRYPAPAARSSPRRAPGLLSVIVPVHRHERYLPACIGSILSQPGPDFEVVLVDDGSASAEVDRILDDAARDPRCRVLRNDGNLGIARTLNRGVEEARGTHFAFVDCDDELMPGALSRVRALLDQEPTAFLSSRLVDIDHEGRSLGERPRRERPEDLYRGNFAGHLKVVAREVLEAIGPFDPSIDGCQDYDLALRCAERFPLRFVDDVLYRYRWHGGTVSVEREREQEARAERVRGRARLRRFLADGKVRKGALFGVEVVLLGAGADAPPAPAAFDVETVRLEGGWDAAREDLLRLPAAERERLVHLSESPGPPLVLLVAPGTTFGPEDVIRSIQQLVTELSRSAVVPTDPARPPSFTDSPRTLHGAGMLARRGLLARLADPAAARASLAAGELGVEWAWGVAAAAVPETVRPGS